jgi:hypothetical protein
MRHVLVLLPAILLGCQPHTVAPTPQAVGVRCGTPLHLRDALSRKITRPIAAKADGMRALRDGYGTFASPILSEHFALKTGPDVKIDPAFGKRVLEGLELAYAVEVTQHGLPAPTGNDAYYLNVYAGNSGGGAPEIPFEGAYVTSDPEGHPIITVHPVLLEGDAAYADAVTAHELYHTIQMATGSYATSEAGYWYWEATAEWAASQVYPKEPESAVGAYALMPHVSLDYVDYPDTGTAIEMHHYGAAIFPRYLTEQVADWTLVRDSWSKPSDANDPLKSIDALLQPLGKNVADTFAAFAAHNATWDYAFGKQYRAMGDQWAKYYPKDDARFALDLPPTGQAGFVEPPAATVPWKLGYNLVRVKAPAPGVWDVGFAGNPTGTEGSPSAFRVTLVRERAAGPEYATVPLVDHAGAAEVTVDGDLALYLVVASQPDAAAAEEGFGYTVRLEPRAEPVGPPMTPEPPPAMKGGGCAVPTGGTDGSTGLAAFSLVLVAVVLNRLARRRG